MKYLFVPVLALICLNANASIPHMKSAAVFEKGQCVQEVNPDFEEWDYRPAYQIIQVGHRKYLVEDEMNRKSTIEIGTENDYKIIDCSLRRHK